MNFNFWELLERGIRFDAKNRIIYRVIILHYVVKKFLSLDYNYDVQVFKCN